MEDTKINFKGQSIYIGLDVHLKSWKVCFRLDEFEHGVHTMPPSPKALSNYLRKYFPNGDYYSVYEAGYCGYWIHEELESYGIKNTIVNPLDVPTKDKEKRVKTDRIDCRKLARHLRNGELDTIFIRDKEQQQDRSLVRMRYTLVKKQTICKNQIKSLLAFYGIQIEEEKIQSHWSKNFIKWIDESTKQMGSATLTFEILLNELKDIRELVSTVTKQIRVLSDTDRYNVIVKLLRSIPGISVLSAMTIITEIGDIKNFDNLDKLNGYIGLIPNEHSSGEKEIKTRMTHRGNKILKNILVECSWMAVRKDPSLILAYKNYIKKHKSTKAIIKITRKLVSRIRFVLINQQEYKLSVV
jgi:transposase